MASPVRVNAAEYKSGDIEEASVEKQRWCRRPELYLHGCLSRCGLVLIKNARYASWEEARTEQRAENYTNIVLTVFLQLTGTEMLQRQRSFTLFSLYVFKNGLRCRRDHRSFFAVKATVRVTFLTHARDCLPYSAVYVGCTPAYDKKRTGDQGRKSHRNIAGWPRLLQTRL